MNAYTDPKLLDVVRALEQLPELPLDGIRKAAEESLTASAAG